jgi:hypothetical protein
LIPSARKGGPARHQGIQIRPPAIEGCLFSLLLSAYKGIRGALQHDQLKIACVQDEMQRLSGVYQAEGGTDEAANIDPAR